MINRESIKEVLLSGGSIKYPHKESVESWFGEVAISMYKPLYESGMNETEICINYSNRRYTLDEIDEAIDVFFEYVFGDGNIAFVFREAMVNLEMIDYDGDEEDTKKIEDEIRRIRSLGK